MDKKTKNKNEIVIINKFKEDSVESATTTLLKVFEMFCNMQLMKK